MARKILLADDSVTAQNMGRRILSDAGYEVITVNNGSAALKKIAELVPDLIILDVYMPGYGGLEVCQRLKESQATARIPVLLTVGKLEPFKVDEARRVRADAHIVKPFDSTELLAAIIKLEDKIVPLPAAGKQGRSAKAVNNEEIASRRSRDKSSDPASETTSGWKKRLSIPRNVPAVSAAEDVEEIKPEPVTTAFHDLSTGGDQKPVETKLPEPPAVAAAAHEPPALDETPISTGPFENFTVERLMAIEAGSPAFEIPSPQHEAEPQPAQITPEVQAAEVISSEAPTLEPIPTIHAPRSERSPSERSPSEQSPSEAEVMAALASLSPVGDPTSQSAIWTAEHRVDAQAMPEGLKVSEFAESAPVTALATALAAVGTVCGGPRWIAEAVPLSDGDSHLILESEMETAYAAFAADESARTSAVVNEAASTADAIDSAPVMTSAPVHSDETSSETQQIPDSSHPSSNKEVKETPAAPEFSVAENVADTNHELLSPVPVELTAESLANQTAEALRLPEPFEAKAELAQETVQETTSSIGFREIAYAAAASAGSSTVETNRAEVNASAVQLPERRETSFDLPPAAPADISVQPAELPEPVQGSPGEAHIPAGASPPNAGNQERESQLAAAWQNWRQIRESIVGPQLTSQITEVASAGFKQLRDEGAFATNQPEAETAASNEPSADASTIAGIVDSVFAELKPKLMAEIAKKLAQDRK